MALGFIKKVFSFGKKDDETAKPSEAADASPLSPLEGEMSAQPTEGGASPAEPTSETHDVDLTKEEAIERTEWDADLPDPEPAPGVSAETAADFAAEHTPAPEPVHHVPEIDHEQAEERAVWDADLPDPEPETPLSPLEGEMSAQPTEGGILRPKGKIPPSVPDGTSPPQGGRVTSTPPTRQHPAPATRSLPSEVASPAPVSLRRRAWQRNSRGSRAHSRRHLR